MYEKKFWMIYNPAASPPRVKHYTYDEAHEEIKRLAYSMPGGHKFYLLEAVSCFGVVGQLQQIMLTDEVHGKTMTASEVREVIHAREQADKRATNSPKFDTREEAEIYRRKFISD